MLFGGEVVLWLFFSEWKGRFVTFLKEIKNDCTNSQMFQIVEFDSK